MTSIARRKNQSSNFAWSCFISIQLNRDMHLPCSKVMTVMLVLANFEKQMRMPWPRNLGIDRARANHRTAVKIFKNKDKFTSLGIFDRSRECALTAINLCGERIFVLRKIERVHQLRQLQKLRHVLVHSVADDEHCLFHFLK